MEAPDVAPPPGDGRVPACCRVEPTEAGGRFGVWAAPPSEGGKGSVQAPPPFSWRGVGTISGARRDPTGDVALKLTRFHSAREVSLQLPREEVRIGSAPSHTLTGKSKLPGKSQAGGARGNQLPWRSAGGGAVFCSECR